MNDNPILYSDLVKDDGAIQNLINQLNEAINAFDTAKGKLQTTATELAKSLQSISGATEEQRQSISKAVQETEKLIEAYKNEDSAQRAAYREKQKVTQAQKEAQQIDKLTIQLNNAKKGSYNALSAEYRLLKIELNAMSAAERNTFERMDPAFFVEIISFSAFWVEGFSVFLAFLVVLFFFSVLSMGCTDSASIIL